MGTTLRQRWDTVNDRPATGRPPLAQEARRHREALSKPVSQYWAKMVHLPSGETEISVTPTNFKSVINARMGFNPLLDCPRKNRSAEDQEQRDKENRQRSAKRARQKVRHLIKTIEADHMLTFGYRDNVTDRERLSRDWKEFSRLFHQRYPEWKYVAVIEKQERGAYHMHVAVCGKQDIRWLLRCWLLSIGQPAEEVNQWLIHGDKLGEKSLGAVNVQAQKRRWGSVSNKWKSGKLAGYLTKYFSKEFSESDKSAKKYWHSRSIKKPFVRRFHLSACDWSEAVREAYDLMKYAGVEYCEMWGDVDADVLWFTGKARSGQCDGPPLFEFNRSDFSIEEPENYSGEF